MGQPPPMPLPPEHYGRLPRPPDPNRAARIWLVVGATALVGMSIPLFWGVYGVLSCSALTPLAVVSVGTYWLHRLCAKWFRGRGRAVKAALTAASALVPTGVTVGLLVLSAHPDMVFQTYVVSSRPASVRVLEASFQPVFNDSAVYLHFTTSAADFDEILAARRYEAMDWDPPEDEIDGHRWHGLGLTSETTPQWFRPERMGNVTCYQFRDDEATEVYSMAVNDAKTEVYFEYVEW